MPLFKKVEDWKWKYSLSFVYELIFLNKFHFWTCFNLNSSWAYQEPSFFNMEKTKEMIKFEIDIKVFLGGVLTMHVIKCSLQTAKM